jgi:O-acetyl-ADP-ribose deacetylase (regulator of RNase III)
MIQEVQGDILLSKAEAIAHGIGVDDDFKQGLALSLRERWPSLYKDFRHFCHTRSPKQGEVWDWKGPQSAVIFNLFTQSAPVHAGNHPGRADLPAVGHSLRELSKKLKDGGYKSVAITRLATGVGGLDWDDVRPLIKQHLEPLNIPVYLYTQYVKDQFAE